MHAWEQIQLTVDYIESHISEDTDITALAGMAALSPFYFQRLFKRLVKKPVQEYVRLRRLALSTEKLLESDARIIDVALDLGFGSHEHFTRAFRQAFGMTPEAYRAKPVALNRMTKPELLLNYVLIDENVPLIADGIVLEISRRTLSAPRRFAGMEMELPVSIIFGLGTESGVDPMDDLWNNLHASKAAMGIPESNAELGVLLPGDREGYCRYFAGGEAGSEVKCEAEWSLPAGEYAVCAFEAESFGDLVMDALYKAQRYLYDVWLASHKLTTEPFSAELYASHGEGTTAMELWVKLVK